MQINGQTRIVAVLGHPIGHTASPAMHNAAFEALGLNWRYVAFDVDPKHLATAVRGLAAAGLVGVNLTLPHKVLAMRFLDYTDSTASQLGAANTLRFSLKNGKPSIMGYNTDGNGLLQALKDEFSFSPPGKRIAIVGCGGAGRGAAIQLAMAGAKKLILINRTREKAWALARSIKRLVQKTDVVFDPEACDLVIQATSLGLHPSDPLPIPPKYLRAFRARYLFDMIYRPARTRMMKSAAKEGCQVANGLSMLLHQGAEAFEIWTGRKAPIKAMRKALMKELKTGQ